MADKYLSAYYDGNNGNKIYLELHVYTVATSIANNTTTERADLYAVVNDASYQWYNGYGSEAFIGINGNNTTKTVTFDYRTTGVKALISTWDTVVKHDNNGAASIGISAHHYSGVGLGNASVSGTYTCDTIPRYATSNQSLNSKTETTIKMNWSSDNTIDYIWYSTNNGSSWTGVDVTDGKSGTYTISNLSANTSYNIKTRVRRKDSQLTTDSSTLAVKTYSYPAQSLKSKAETTITINWSADSTVDMIYYSTNDGSTWSSGISVNATSGNYTISGLNEYTTYKIKTRIRRKATQTLSNTSTLSVTTYPYPYCTSTPNFTIGSALTLTFYNPLGRSITITGIGADSSTIFTGSTTGTSLTGFNDSGSVTKQYASIPSAKSSTYQVQVTYNGVTKTRNNGNTYSIKGTEKPTFTNFTFADTSTNAINLTGNNQIFIKGVSDVAVTISTANKAVGNNSASISKYRITIGNTTGEVTYSSNASVSYTFANVTSGTISVSAIDSRGLETTVIKTTTFKDWWLPTITNVEVYRENGIGTKCLFELDGKYWNNNFGSVDNIFLTAYYRYKKSTDSTYSSYINIGNRFTYSDGNYNSKTTAFLPTTNFGTTAVEFEVGVEYNIQFMVQDKTGTFAATYSKVLILNSGIPCTAKQKNSDGTYSIGINKLPDGKSGLDVKGAINTDQLRLNGEATINKDENGSIYICATNSQKLPPLVFRPNGINSGTGQAYFDVNGNLVLASTLKTQSGKYIMNFRGHVNDSFTFNQAIDTGIYSVGSGNGLPDAPYTGWIYGVLEVIVNDMTTWNKSDNWIFQRFRTTTGLIYERQAINADNWTSWKQIAQNVGISAYKDVKTLYDVGSVGWNGQTDGDSYLVTKAFMAFWNGLYNDAGGSNLIYCRDGTIQSKPTTLYSNATGSNGTVTLSETSANFTYLEIFCRKNNSAYYVTQKVYSPNGKKVSIIGSWSAKEGGYALLQFNTKIIQISGTSITSPGAGSGNLKDDDTNWVDNTANDLYIVRVVGYK